MPEAANLALSYEYNPVTGEVHSKTKKTKLAADENSYVSVTDPVLKKKHKIQIGKLCYLLWFNEEPPKGYKIFYKNLDKTDCRIENIGIISESNWKILKEAIKNIQGGIRLSPHPIDRWAHRLYWFENGIEKLRIIQDFGVAKRLELKLKLKYSKVVSKFCYCD